MADIVLKNKKGEDVVYYGVTTVSFNTTDEDKLAVYTEGEAEEKSVELDFSSGDMEIVPGAGKVITKVHIACPENLVPENIKDGVVVAGIPGGMMGSDQLPQLNAVSISRNSNIVTITNPSTNGNFVEGYKVYNHGKLVLRLDNVSSFGVELLNDGAGEYSVTVAPVNDKFVDGEQSGAVTATMRGITEAFTNLGSETVEKVTLDGLGWSTVIVPDDGYYLPEDITVTQDGEAKAFTYDSYTGELTIENITGEIVVTAVAFEAPKLRRSALEVNDQSLTVTLPKYSDWTNIYADDELIDSLYHPTTFWLEDVEGAEYGFALNGSGYWQSGNKAVASSYAIAKILIHAVVDTTVTLSYISYGESANDYGIISELDTMLALSNEADTEGVKQSCKGASSSSVKTLTYDVAAGEHFICVKYIKDSATNSYNDTLQVKVSATN